MLRGLARAASVTSNATGSASPRVRGLCGQDPRPRMGSAPASCPAEFCQAADGVRPTGTRGAAGYGFGGREFGGRPGVGSWVPRIRQKMEQGRPISRM